TRGTICGGSTGCAMTQRSGWAHSDCMLLIDRVAELEAMMVSTGAAASNCANNLILRSRLSGAHSCTKSTSAAARDTSFVNERCSGDPLCDKPSAFSVVHAASTNWRNFASAPGCGFAATTSNPRAKYS